MNFNTDIAIKTENAKEKILDLIPFKDKDKEDSEWRYDFHIYLLEFLSQTLIISDDLIVEVSENLFSYNFGLICWAAINNLSLDKNNYLFFEPKAQVELLGESESFYEMLRKEYTPWLVYKLYGTTSENNFRALISYDWESVQDFYTSQKKYTQPQSSNDHEEHRVNLIRKQKLSTASMFTIPFVQFGKDPFEPKQKYQSSKKKRTYSTSQCLECKGEGKIEKISGMNYWEDCEKCDGTGQEKKAVLHDNEVYCDACDGLGKIDVFKDRYSNSSKETKDGYIDSVFERIKLDPSFSKSLSNFHYWQECTKCDGSGVRPKKNTL